MSNQELITVIFSMEKKIKKLEKQGPGAAMAAAVNSVRLRELQFQLAQNEETEEV